MAKKFKPTITHLIIVAIIFLIIGYFVGGQTDIQLKLTIGEEAPREVETATKDNTCVDWGCPNDTEVVGSVNSDKWHYCHCRYVGTILPKNLICFSSIEEAESRGYVETKVC